MRLTNDFAKTVVVIAVALGLHTEANAGVGPDIFLKILLHPTPLGDGTCKAGCGPMKEQEPKDSKPKDSKPK